MRESTIECYFISQVKAAGGFQEKHVSPGRRGPPDRIVTWTFPYIDFVELKRPKKGAEPHQKRDHKRRMKYGHKVWVIDTKLKVDAYIKYCLHREHRLAMIAAENDSTP